MPKAIHDKKIVWQRNRWVKVYGWALQAADEILEATSFCRMVYPGTDPVIYLAEIITEKADQTLSDRLLYERMEDLYKYSRAPEEDQILENIKNYPGDLVGGLNATMAREMGVKYVGETPMENNNE